MIKGKFGSHLRSKCDTGQIKQNIVTVDDTGEQY